MEVGKYIEVLQEKCAVEIAHYDPAFLSKAINERISFCGCKTEEEYLDYLRHAQNEPTCLLAQLSNLYSEYFRSNPQTIDLIDASGRTQIEMSQQEIFEFDQSLLKTIPFGMDIVDDQGNILFVNEIFENVFGKEVVGKKCWEIYCDDKKQCHNCPLHKGIEIGKTDTHVAKNIMGGMVFEITYTGMMFKGKKAMLEIFIDITERKRAEDVLNESQQLFQGLFNASPDAIVLIDPHHPTISWPIIDCNDASCQMNGYTREEMIGQSIDLLNTREGTKEERAAYFSLLRQKGIIHDEFVHRSKDGRIFPVEVSTSIVNLSGRELVLGIDRDITQRKQAEEKLKKSYDLLNKITAQVPGVVYQYRLYPDGHSAFPYSSPGMFDIYEVTSEQVREDASAVFTRIHPDDYNYIAETILESARTQTFYHSEFRVILPIQGLRWRMCDAKPELLDDGSTLWHGIIMDITERKLVEETLNENNTRLQLAMKAANMAWWEMDIATGNVNFESRKAEMLGYPPEMFKHFNDFMNLIHPDDVEPIMNAMKAHLKGLTDKFESEYRILSKSGDYKWFYDIGSILKRNSKGKPLIVAGLVLNINERKRAEVALKNSEDRYRGFISQVSEGVYRFESDEPMSLDMSLEEQVDFIYDHMFVAECNEAFLKMYGLSNQNEIIGKSHLDFHGGRNNPINRGLLRKFVECNYCIENGITEEYNSSGHLMYISNNSLGIIENNHLVRMWGTQIDITDKMRADQVQKVLYTISNAALSSIHLAELIEIISKQLGTLLDSTNFYIAFIDEESGTLSTHYEKDEKDEINSWPAEKSMTGYIIRSRKSMLATEADVIKLCEAGEVEIVGTPSKIWLGVPLFVNKKVIGAIVVQSYDNPEAYTEKDKLMLEFISHQVSISIERKKAEQEMKDILLKAQESDRLKSAFLANMSHEIRTPLNSIIGFAELLLDADFTSDQHEEFARMIGSSGNGLLAIITDIMDLSKIEAGQIQINPCYFSVQQLLNGIRKEYSHKAHIKGIDLILDPENPKEELIIESDELRLKQVLINFVGNAIKFTDKGSIEIGFRKTKDSVYFSVKDTGIGIPNEYHRKIFERFRQIESPYSRKYGGNGLGLAISKSLIELLGGEIGMKSESGKGSTFYFTIPLVES